VKNIHPCTVDIFTDNAKSAECQLANDDVSFSLCISSRAHMCVLYDISR